MLNLFLPIRINNNFFISEKIVVLYITEYTLTALLIHASGYKRVIKKQFFFEFSNRENFQDESIIVSLLSKALTNWKFDYVKIVLSGNLAIFRSLYLPFSDIEKIKMIAPFELESLLPFQLSEASLDVLHQNKIKNTENNKILAVITKDVYINFYREIAKKLDIKIQAISVDAVEIVNNFLYYFISQYAYYMVLYRNFDIYGLFLFSKDGLIAIKYIDLTNYQENFHESFELLEKSIVFIGKECNINLQEIPLYKIGISDKNDVVQKIQEKNIFKIVYDSLPDSIEKVILIEDKNESFLSKNSFLLIISKLYYQNVFFDLGGKDDNNGNNLLFKQIIVAIVLSILLYVVLIGFIIIDFYKINTVVNDYQTRAINFLKSEFKLNSKYTGDIDKAYSESKKMIISLEHGLPVPVTHNKFLFIHLFEKITKAVPLSVKGLQIFEMKWKLGVDGTPSILFLQGKVDDFDSLHNLENALKNLNLFVTIPQQQDLYFSFNLTILNKEGSN